MANIMIELDNTRYKIEVVCEHINDKQLSLPAQCMDHNYHQIVAHMIGFEDPYILLQQLVAHHQALEILYTYHNNVSPP